MDRMQTLGQRYVSGCGFYRCIQPVIVRVHTVVASAYIAVCTISVSSTDIGRAKR